MKILYAMDSPFSFNNGCWFYRNNIPSKALKAKGHQVKFIAIGAEIPQQWKEWPDVVVFSRIYPRDPMIYLREWKRMGKRVVYELDDDLWSVAPDNPAYGIREEKQRQYEHFMAEADAVTTTTQNLANKIKRFNKNVFVIPNAIDYEMFEKRDANNKQIVVGYTGASSHYADLGVVTEALIDLQKKYSFTMVLQGLTTPPLESEMYSYAKVDALGLQPEKKLFFSQALGWFERIKQLSFVHIPFHFPELYPSILRRCNIDIGIAPLLDSDFNYSKSCVKFYEYASTGTVTLASDVKPYKDEVSYCAKNTKDDWYKKLEKLIVDQKFRDELYAKQYQWVKENRDIRRVVVKWEEALDPGPDKSNGAQIAESAPYGYL
jgi:glycosyltransferase involved in cell wall biosynthesis